MLSFILGKDDIQFCKMLNINELQICFATIFCINCSLFSHFAHFREM